MLQVYGKRQSQDSNYPNKKDPPVTHTGILFALLSYKVKLENAEMNSSKFLSSLCEVPPFILPLHL